MKKKCKNQIELFDETHLSSFLFKFFCILDVYPSKIHPFCTILAVEGVWQKFKTRFFFVFIPKNTQNTQNTRNHSQITQKYAKYTKYTKSFTNHPKIRKDILIYYLYILPIYYLYITYIYYLYITLYITYILPIYYPILPYIGT